MYGGVVFETDAGNPGTRALGYFVYEKHSSLEFTHDTQFDDPSNTLEDKGKLRRHLKLYELDDIKRLDTNFFIRQAFEKYLRLF